MPITPDTKDWTWVLERTCPECGFDVTAFPREETGTIIRNSAQTWQGFLADDKATQRPSDDVWSALEYGCHARDVFELYDQRLQMMLESEDPLYPNWDQDEAAIAGSYEDEDPTKVAGEIDSAGRALADRFDGVHGEQWERPGRRSDHKSFTVESFARYMIHDIVHHLHDVERGYERLSAS